jgi:membrane-associated phospholipid phosphatase
MNPEAATPTWRSPLQRIEWLLDRSTTSRSAGVDRMRMLLGVIFLIVGIVLLVLQIAQNTLTPQPLSIIVFSLFLFTNRLGSFGRYFIPIFVGAYAYAAVSDYASTLRLSVHYKPQIEFDRALTLGHGLPTVALQQHLYHGHTGPLEALAVAAYAGHFLVPFALATGLILTRREQMIKVLMFSLLTASVAAMVVFVVAPTAPPWLADQQGYITGVHHILKQSLADLHMSSLAAVEGDGSKYDITAAMPSLHTAWALLGYLTARRARLPRAATAFLALNVAAVVFSIVYTGEHYIGDVLAGAILAGAAWKAVAMLSQRVTAPGRTSADGLPVE